MVNEIFPRGIEEYRFLTKKITDNPENKIKLQKGCIVLIGPEVTPENYVTLVARISLERCSILPIFYKKKRDSLFILDNLHTTALGMQVPNRLVCYCPPEGGLEASLGYIAPSANNPSLEGNYQPYKGDFSLKDANPFIGIFNL